MFNAKRGSNTFNSREFAAALADPGPGSRWAGRSLVERYRPLLRARFFGVGVAAQDIDDLISEVLTSIVANVDQVRDHSRFDAWVYSIATNVLNQHWTARGRARDMFQQLTGTAAQTRSESEDAEALLDLIADPGQSDLATAHCIADQLEAFRVKHPHRYACIDLVVRGYDTGEISAQIGRTNGATRQFISQCCALVTQFLAPCLDAGQLLGRKRGRAEAE